APRWPASAAPAGGAEVSLAAWLGGGGPMCSRQCLAGVAEALGLRRGGGEPAPSGRAVEARRQAAALAGPPEDPQTVQGRLTLLEAQATKLKATIQRRKQLRDGPAILGHYERVLAALEGEIASLGGAAAARTAAS
ncbi:unnamed protein product, partial [Prorocentrum cordatum]